MEANPNPKIGRNDPCPCGSGKKYKRCCLAGEPAAGDSLLLKVKSAHNHLLEELGDFFANKFGERIVEVWEDYNFGNTEEAPDPEDPDQLVFVAFSMLHWDPDYSEYEYTNLKEGGIVARSFLQQRSYRLNELDRRVLEVLMVQPFSFYEVLSCRPGDSFVARDLWTEEELVVFDPLITEEMLAGDILYTQLLPVSGITILALGAPYPIPLEMKAAILEYRAIVQESSEIAGNKFSKDDLRRHQDDLRELFLEISDVLRTPPELRNTDGEPIVLHTMTFTIGSAQTAFDALAPLSKGNSKEDLLARAKLDSEGKIVSVDFPWLKKGNSKFASWDNTILGSIHINGRTLTAEANSEKRAARLRRLIERRLGPAAVHEATVVKSSDELLEAEPEGPATEVDSEVPDEVLRNPEAQRAMRDFLQNELDAWASRRLPVLGNRTPLEAVKDPETRGTVESVLSRYERTLKHNFPAEIRPDSSNLRKLLAL